MPNERADSICADKTEPTELPTATHEYEHFEDEGGTPVEADTMSVTARDGSEDLTPALQKFRRPTPSEIADAVDRVKTQTLDVGDIAYERLSHEDTDDQEIEEGVESSG